MTGGPAHWAEAPPPPALASCPAGRAAKLFLLLWELIISFPHSKVTLSGLSQAPQTAQSPKKLTLVPEQKPPISPHIWGPFGLVPQHVLGKRPRCHGDALSRFLRARPGTIICRVRGFGLVARVSQGGRQATKAAGAPRQSPSIFI